MTSAVRSHEMILILDFGSQYTQLIARRVREAHVYCEIVPFNTDLAAYRTRNVAGYILSGGPASLADPDSPRLAHEFFNTNKPILGICYGMQLLADLFGGELVEGVVLVGGREHAVTSGSYAYVPAGSHHQFKNTGSGKFRFICIVPKEGHQ